MTEEWDNRRAKHSGRARYEPDTFAGLWKHIAIGIILGGLGVFVILLIGWMMYLRIAFGVIDRSVSDATQQMQRELRQQMPPPPRPVQTQRAAPVPLRSDERCIDGQRLQRIENGWRQVGSC